jgi:predicted DsbA family dithiol-disulfide isomerase
MMTESTTATPLRIDIVSDVVCPWCVIGYKQLQRALDTLDGVFDVDLHWQPFELNPRLPVEGQDLREHLTEKYGTSTQQSAAARTWLTELGEALDFRFDYFEGMRIYNTFLAHQLLHWAAQYGKQTELKLALFEAFFSHRQSVGDIASLVNIAGSAGLDAHLAREILLSGKYVEPVRQEQARWMDRDVHAVPMFYFNDGFGVPGAQEPETFVRVLNKLRQRS